MNNGYTSHMYKMSDSVRTHARFVLVLAKLSILTHKEYSNSVITYNNQLWFDIKHGGEI
jgi:hypothetical protein